MAPVSEEAPVFVPPQSIPAPAPAPAPEPALTSAPIAASSSTTSKRRWSPSTWRYAIEEGQPELGSRPRSSHSQLLYSGTVSSTKKADYESLKINKKHHHIHHHQQQQVLLQNHLHQPKEVPTKRPKLEEGTDDDYNDEKEGEKGRNRLHHEEDNEFEEQPEIEGEWLARDRIQCGYDNDSSKRRRQKREMSPSELYFCEFCSAKKGKAPASGMKLNRTKRSPGSAVPDS